MFQVCDAYLQTDNIVRVAASGKLSVRGLRVPVDDDDIVIYLFCKILQLVTNYVSIVILFNKISKFKK